MRRTQGNIVLNVLFGTIIIGGILATIVSTSVREARTAQVVATSNEAQARAKNTLLGAENSLYNGIRTAVKDSLNSSANYNAAYYFQVGNLPSGNNDGLALPSWGTPGSPASPAYISGSSAPSNTASQRLQASIDSFVCHATTPDRDFLKGVTVRLYVSNSGCGIPLPDGVALPSPYFLSGTTAGPGHPAVQSYAFPFVLIGQADLPDEPGSAQLLKMSGEFRVTLGSPSLTHWALAANSMQNSSGINQFLDSSVLLTGPVHVNTALAFQGKPYLDGVVSSSSCGYVTADICASGQAHVILPEGDKTPNALLPSPGKPCTASVCPSLTSGNIDYYAAPALATSNSLKTAAGTAGLLFPQSAQRVQLHAGTDPDGTEYQYLDVLLLDNSTFSYRVSSLGVMQQTPDGGLTWSAPRLFNGVIYVQGSINALSNRDGDGDTALARFAPISVGADNDINVTSSLTYTVPPCSELPRVENGTLINPSCQNTSSLNVLGIYSNDGDIVLGTANTNNLTVDAALMSRVGTIRPARTSGGQYINLLGSLFEGQYTPMNYYDGGSSYALRFGFDPRFSQEIGYAPSAWPTTVTNQVLSINVEISKAVRVDTILPNSEITPAGGSGSSSGTTWTPINPGTPANPSTSGGSPAYPGTPPPSGSGSVLGY